MSPQRLQEHRVRTADRFETMRETARRATVARFPGRGVDLRKITLVEAASGRMWNEPVRADGIAWDWVAIWSLYRVKYPDRFETAAFGHGTLSGLAIGRPSRQHTQLGLDFLQGNPDPTHPLAGHVVPIIIMAAKDYALAIGAKQLRLMNPLERLQKHYIRRGFVHVRKSVKGRADTYMYLNL